LTKRNIERQFVQSQVENAKKKAHDLELEVQHLINIIQKQK